MTFGNVYFTPEATAEDKKIMEYNHGISLPIEQITYQWSIKAGFSTKGSLTFASPPEEYNKQHSIVISRCRKKVCLGLCEFSLEQAKAIYRSWPKMPEQVYNFCDQPGVTPDIQWFEKRNKKLGIKWEDCWESYTVPARSLAPLILSYVTSTRGMVIVERDLAERNDTYIISDIYKIKCVFLAGPEDNFCWEENLILLESKLLKYFENKSIRVR